MNHFANSSCKCCKYHSQLKIRFLLLCLWAAVVSERVKAASWQHCQRSLWI